VKLKKVLFPFVILAAIVASSAFAAAVAEYVVTPSPGFLDLKENTVGYFDITIQNNMGTEERFEIYVPEVTWDLTTIPAGDRVVTLEPGQRKTIKAQISPLYVNPGLYGVELNVRVSGKNMLITNYLTVNVGALYTPVDEYLPAIKATLEMPDEIDPREEVKITLFLDNQNRRSIEKADINLRGHLINKDYETSLNPLEKKSIDFTVKLDNLTTPQEDVLRTIIFVPTDEKIFQFEIVPSKFSIIEYGGLESEEIASKGFLKRVKTLRVTNKGNAVFSKPYTLDSSLWEQWFTSAEPEASSYKIDGKRRIGWDVTLNPGDSIVFVVTVSYVPVFIALLLIAGAIAVYLSLRSPIVLEKNATVLATKEGGISELKILIVLKNRSRKKVDNVAVIDKVSHIAEVKKEFELGTLKPSKVLKHAKKGTLIKWEMEEIDPHEERILAYKIRSKLSVLGEFTLPVAVVKYRGISGRERVSHSNTVTLTTQ
jgi:hypothetical protein